MEFSLDDPSHLKAVLEAALLVTDEPLPVAELCRLFDGAVSQDLVRRLLEDLQLDWKHRGAELVRVAGGWRFQGRAEFQRFLDRLDPQKAPRYSRAVMETLAIIAYRQPVTRGDIESIRGVSVSAGVLRTLESRGWIEVVGHRETPGRPALYSTTVGLLNDLQLRSLEELPPLQELGNLVVTEAPAQAGLLAQAAVPSEEKNGAQVTLQGEVSPEEGAESPGETGSEAPPETPNPPLRGEAVDVDETPDAAEVARQQ